MTRLYKFVIWKLVTRKLLLVMILLLGLVVLLGPTEYAKLKTSGERYDATYVGLDSIPKRKVAIVFGARVYKDGRMSPYLRDRTQTAINLYKAGRVSELLMSGGRGVARLDEADTMAQFAEKQGVPASAILLDHKGVNTRATCVNAKQQFHLSSATLVSQGYHIPRAIIVCDNVGVQSIAVTAIRPDGDDSSAYAVFRECISTWKAVLQILL